MPRKTEINKGKIQDNALKALVKSNLFRHKIERPKKGKGSYDRRQAKKWQDGSLEPSFRLFPFTTQLLKRSPIHFDKTAVNRYNAA